MREINYTKHMTMKDAPVLRKTGAVAADGDSLLSSGKAVFTALNAI